MNSIPQLYTVREVAEMLNLDVPALRITNNYSDRKMSLKNQWTEKIEELEAEVTTLRRQNLVLAKGAIDKIVTDAVKKMQADYSALKKMVDDAPEITIDREIGLKEMQPGETRTFKLVGVDNGESEALT